MFKRPYALVLASFLFIPVVTVLGGTVFSAINSEIAAAHPNFYDYSGVKCFVAT